MASSTTARSLSRLVQRPPLSMTNPLSVNVLSILFVAFSLWRQGMEIQSFSALLALCERNPLVTGGFPSQRQVTQSLVYSLICAWTNGWANNRDADDLRRHRDHYDVTEMHSIRTATSCVRHLFSEYLLGRDVRGYEVLLFKLHVICRKYLLFDWTWRCIYRKCMGDVRSWNSLTTKLGNGLQFNRWRQVSPGGPGCHNYCSRKKKWEISRPSSHNVY